MWIDLAFVFMGFIADNILRMIFPVDTSLRLLVFVPNLGYLAFLYVMLKKPMPFALLMAVILGLSVDVIRHEMIANAIAYPIGIYAVKVWSNQLNESLFEQVFVGLIGLFLKEFALFIFLFTIRFSQLGLWTWFVHREFLTLIGHIPLLMGLSYLGRIKTGTQKTLDQRKQRRERVLWNPTVKP